MAGYIFSLDSLNSLHLYTTNGVYGTKLSPPSHSWRAHHEGTFADYATMRAGDNIYFFIQRKIYGIGRLVNIGSDCKFLSTSRGDGGVFEFESFHGRIAGRLSPEYGFEHGMSAVLAGCAHGDRLRHEMAIEAGVVHQLSVEDADTCRVFGNWDYLSHQERLMQKCEIHLPLNYTDRSPIEQEKITRVQKDLLAAFGSFTVPSRRTWRYDGLGCVEILKIEILTTGDKLSKKHLKKFKERLKEYLPQIDILVTKRSIQVI